MAEKKKLGAKRKGSSPKVKKSGSPTTRKSATKKVKKAKLGTGKRFAKLEGELKDKGAKNPGALAAWIGRRKYGAKKMANWSAAGRRRAKKS